MDSNRARAWKQLALSYAITNGLVFVFSRPFAQSFGAQDLISALFLIATIASVNYDDENTQRYGIRMAGLFPGRDGDPRALVRVLIEGIPHALRELGVAVALGLLILPVYALGWPLFNHPPPVRSFALTPERWTLLATELFAVALTEELYFRGFIFTRLCDAFGLDASERTLSHWKKLTPAILVSSALFALTHLTVERTLPRAVVFFPGILFCIVRIGRGGIGAATFLHAMANTFERYLEGR